MPPWVQETLPWMIVLFFASVARSQTTYWLGRLVPALTAKYGKDSPRLRKWDARLNSPKMSGGAAILDRWGIIAIPLSFLTIGIQSVVQMAAGLMKMRWDVYTIASIPGCVVWAMIYGAGFSLGWQAVVAAASGNTWAKWILGLFALSLVALVIWRTKRSKTSKKS